MNQCTDKVKRVPNHKKSSNEGSKFSLISSGPNSRMEFFFTNEERVSKIIADGKQKFQSASDVSCIYSKESHFPTSDSKCAVSTVIPDAAQRSNFILNYSNPEHKFNRKQTINLSVYSVDSEAGKRFSIRERKRFDSSKDFNSSEDSNTVRTIFISTANSCAVQNNNEASNVVIKSNINHANNTTSAMTSSSSELSKQKHKQKQKSGLKRKSSEDTSYGSCKRHMKSSDSGLSKHKDKHKQKSALKCKSSKDTSNGSYKRRMKSSGSELSKHKDKHKQISGLKCESSEDTSDGSCKQIVIASTTHISQNSGSFESTPKISDDIPFNGVFRDNSLSVVINSCRGLICPSCSKFVSLGEMESHIFACLSVPDINCNEDISKKDEGECVICLEEIMKNDVIARLPCLCIYHKVCIDKWLKIKRSCPQHILN